MTESNRPLLGTRSRVSYAKVGSASFRRLESAEVDIAPNQDGGRTPEAERAARNPARAPGFSRSERFADTFDGLGTRGSSRLEITQLYWGWRKAAHSVAARLTMRMKRPDRWSKSASPLQSVT